MIFEKYDEYKSVDIDWLNQIPNDWGIVRVKDLGNLQNGISQDSSYFGKGYPFVSYGNIYNDTIEFDKIKTLANSTKDDQKAYSVKEGDIFFTRTSENVDEIGFSSTCQKTIENAIFSGFTIRLRASKTKIYKGFSKYYFKASSNRNFFTKNMNIVTRASLGQGLLNQFPTILPPLNTQTKIANYLDIKTKKIDDEIALLEQKIQKYQELKQTLINETVLRGVDKSVELKDSGIEWIGDIPKSWEVKRGKDLFKYNKIINKNLESKNVLSLTYNGVINKDFNRLSGLNPESYETYQFVNRDNLVFKLIDLENIKTSRVGLVHEDGIMSSAYIRLKQSKNIFSKYFYYLYFYYYKINLFNNLGGGVRSTLNYTGLLNISIIVPSKEEQIKIANYLDEKTIKIDTIIKTIKDKIDILKEFRKTLINDVVTGKVKCV